MRPEQSYKKGFSVWSGILTANSCWQPFWTLQCAQPQVPCQVKTALGPLGVECAVCLMVRGVFPATGIPEEWSIPKEWSMPDSHNRRVLCQHWLQGMHPQGPQKEHQELLRCAQHHCRSLTSVWDCFGLAVRGGSFGGTAGLLQLQQTPQPCLVLQRAPGGREGGQKTHSHLSSAVLNLGQGTSAPYSFKEPFLLVPCQVWIQSAFHFR